MRVVRGKKEEEHNDEFLAAFLASYPRRVLEIGCGDAAFAYHYAREHRECAVIALDPEVGRMAHYAGKAARSAKSGGAANLLLLRASFEDLPEGASGQFEELYLLYPWSGLLNVLSDPDESTLAKLRGLLRGHGAELHLLLNYSVHEDKEYAERLGCAAVGDDDFAANLKARYESGAFAVEEVRVLLGEPPFQTTWGQRLSKGSGRSSLYLRARSLAG